MAIASSYRCIRCGKEYSLDKKFDATGCPRCYEAAPANFKVTYRNGETIGHCLGATNSLWRYADYLPDLGKSVVSLGEGLTPLMAAERLGDAIDVPLLFLKDEGRNPTWSHKDRFSTLAVSFARANGAKIVATASSGNAGASLAAYAAKAGLKCVVATFAGPSAAMLAQIRAYGATIVEMAQKVDRWEFLRLAAEHPGWFVASPYREPVIGSHPIGIEGYKTIAYEIFDQSNGDLPVWCILPVCYGDALAGVHQGFLDLKAEGKIGRIPRLVAAEVHGSLSASLMTGQDRVEDQIASFDTIALSIGTTRSTFQALDALRQTEGRAVSVTNDDLLRMQQHLAKTEGVFAELASVAPLVAAHKLREAGHIKRQDRVSAIVTASGLKDVQIAMQKSDETNPFEDAHAAWKSISGNGAISSSDQSSPYPAVQVRP